MKWVDKMHNARTLTQNCYPIIISLKISNERNNQTLKQTYIHKK